MPLPVSVSLSARLCKKLHINFDISKILVKIQITIWIKI